MTVQDAVNWCNAQVGSVLDFDHMYGAQCVDLFSFYYQFLTGHSPFQDQPGVPGAKDLWNLNYPGFSKVINNPADENQLPPQGAILIYDGGLPGSGGNGHVAIVDSATVQQVTVWDQNWGGQYVHHQAHMWTGHELGWMIFDGFTPVAATLPYTIEAIAPKQVLINKPAHLWDLVYDNFTAIDSHPLADVSQGDQKTVVAILHHTIGYDYYLEDANVPHGYNVLDCDDVPVAPPLPPMPPKPPTAPLTAPSLDPYNVVVDVPGYLSPGQALTHGTAQATVTKDTYTIFDRKGGMINVTSTPGKSGWWINPIDNVVRPFVSAFPAQPAPVPAPVEPNWRSTYRAFTTKDGVRTPVKYVALTNYVVKDIATQKADAALHAGQEVTIAGTFIKDGVVYGRPLDAVQDREGNLRGWWYGIPLDDQIIEEYSKVYSTKTTTAERQLLDIMTLYDYAVIGVESIRSFFAPAIAFITHKDRKQ